jgi:hypothetical protein
MHRKRLEGYLKKAARYSWLFVFILILLLAVWRQKRSTNFGCEFCADKAGYYMYLPALFESGFRADNYPDGFDKRYGDGFRLDREKNIIKTKFTCGVALLLLPFFATAYFLAHIFGFGFSFYSGYYQLFINIGAAFYLMLGLCFYMRWLRMFVDAKSALITVVLTFLGTHLLYYALDETLMSHLYSFALFAIILYAAKSYGTHGRFVHFLLFIAAFAMAILIRPTNVLFGFIALLADIKTGGDLATRFRRFFTPRNMLTGILIGFLVFLPQFLYWKFAYGKFVVWSYEGEGFPYAKNPWFATTWFSPQSGLFTYSPILLISLGFAIVMAFRRLPNAVLVLLTFFIVSYICASWNNPYFGMCNFGKRPMVEYLAMLMLPLAFLVHEIRTYSKPLRISLYLLTAVLAYYNLALFLSFDTCFFGDPWDWKKFSGFAVTALLHPHL